MRGERETREERERLSRVYFQNARVECDAGVLKVHTERFERFYGSVL